MISEKQKQKVIELFEQDTPQVTIVKKENISRTKIAEIIKDYKSGNADLSKKESEQENIDGDPEVLKLKKEFAKEQLRRKIREQRHPFEVEKALSTIEDFKGAVYRYVDRVLRNTLLGKGLKYFKCLHCGEEGHVAMNIKCTGCDTESWYGWFPKE